MVDSSSLPESVQEAVCFLAKALPEEDDWLTIKKQVLLSISPNERKAFSTRDQKTKKHHPFNDFERSVRQLWFDQTGIWLQIPPDKRLDEADTEGYG